MNPPMQLESVGTISVSGFLLKVARQVDNGQTAKWTFLGTEQIIKLKLCVHRFVGLLDHQRVTLVKKNTCLDTYSASNTQRFRDPDNLALVCHLYAQFAWSTQKVNMNQGYHNIN